MLVIKAIDCERTFLFLLSLQHNQSNPIPQQKTLEDRRYVYMQ